MESNTKQQQLTFDKGITNVPSDILCSDNALEECMGMVYDDGEHRVIQKPAVFMDMPNGCKLLYIHRLNDEKRYIAALDGSIVWGVREGTVFVQKGVLLGNTTVNDIQITAIGKTLIVSGSDSMHYWLWKENRYAYLGNRIPEPTVEFAMVKDNKVFYEGGDSTGILTVKNEGGVFFIQINDEEQEAYNDLVIGLYNKVLKSIAVEKRFAKPFLIRYALELYDGTYIYQSAPMALFPAVHYNCHANASTTGKVNIFADGLLLFFKPTFDYTEWTDLVKNIVVFASDGVELYDTTVDQDITSSLSLLYHSYIAAEADISPTNKVTGVKDHSSAFHTSTMSVSNVFKPLKSREAADILDDLKSASVFYKLFEAGVKGSGTWESSKGYIKSHTIENLTTQEQLPDDYYSHCSLSGKTMLSYNNRLLLSNVRRSFYEGYSSFLPYDNSQSYDYRIYVYIRTVDGERVVRKELSTYEKIGLYFFYPDPRAYKADVYFADGNFVMSMELKEHPFLNGAYYWESLPVGTEAEPVSSGSQAQPEVNTESEALTNKIWASEVNNPFVFRAEGNITVGNGAIISMSTLTQALSQGQFGQYPLIIFTDEGIWAASTGTTGLFTAVHPMSREVCNNPKSITQTDGAVFFSSEKGLMVVAGSAVKCVSEQLAGKSADPFPTFLRTAVIAYDYRVSLLWIFNPTQTTPSTPQDPLTPSSPCFVYSIKSGTFARYDFGDTQITNIVNNYPDYLLQSGSTVYSLLHRANINDDEALYTAQLVTRPMKFENALALKSLRQVRHIHDLQGSLTLSISASNNLTHWASLRSLRGTPWKYFRFVYDFHNLRATDRFAGTIIVTQERRTDKLR